MVCSPGLEFPSDDFGGSLANRTRLPAIGWAQETTSRLNRGLSRVKRLIQQLGLGICLWRPVVGSETEGQVKSERAFLAGNAAAISPAALSLFLSSTSPLSARGHFYCHIDLDLV